LPVTPAWQAPTSGQQANAGSVNQLLGTHAVTYVYTGAVQASVTTDASAHQSSTVWLAQKFTAGASQTATGCVVCGIGSFTSSGASLPAATLSLQADSGGAPSGTALSSVTVYTEYAYAASSHGSSSALVFYPLPATGLTASGTYWLVLSAASSGGNHYTWEESTAGSGASTSTNGTSWTAQAYGFRHQVYDASAVMPLLGTWEDSGARWTAFTWNGAGALTGLYEYTAGQTTAGYTYSTRALTYTSGLLTGVA
jgi:hypothetical protein